MSETEVKEESTNPESEDVENPPSVPPGEKFNLPKHRRLKLRRHHLMRQNSRRHEACFKKSDKFSRKRLHGGKFFTSSYKRRKKQCGVIIPPTKFLLGGNIRDPLNLNSLQDEETNRMMNAATPKSSPLPTSKRRRGEVEVLIPRNLKDPLNLISCADDEEYEMDLRLAAKRAKKNRHRKRKRGSSGSGSGKDEGVEIPKEEATPPPTPLPEVERADPPPQRKESLSLVIKERRRKIDVKDKIVSPVIPQPGAWKRPMLPTRPHRKKKNEKTPNFKQKNSKYQYGNYDRYYGYRNPHHEIDIRLKCLSEHKELFFDKDILDIGCNVGHITLSVARDLGARSAVGLDIDKRLIGIARKNVKHYVNCAETPVYSGGFSMRNPPFESPMYKKHHYSFQDSPRTPRVTPLYAYPESPASRPSHQYCMESPSYTPSGKTTPYYSMESPSYTPSVPQEPPTCRPLHPNHSPYYSLESPGNQSHSSAPDPEPLPAQTADSTTQPPDRFFPISMPILYGPVDPPGMSSQEASGGLKKFPHNVSFVQGNYVLEDEELLHCETAQFDVILALSITKWLHLNWGDAGLKQAFRRMYLQLRPGGRLFLEAQGWASYAKKKTLTETIYNNYHQIEFLPEQFTQYLLSSEVGFNSVTVLDTPQHRARGFRRAIRVFSKPSNTPSSSTPGNVRYTPYAQRACVRLPVYTALTVDEDSSTSPVVHGVQEGTPDGAEASKRGARVADVTEDVLRGSEVTFPAKEDKPEEEIPLEMKEASGNEVATNMGEQLQAMMNPTFNTVMEEPELMSTNFEDKEGKVDMEGKVEGKSQRRRERSSSRRRTSSRDEMEGGGKRARREVE